MTFRQRFCKHFNLANVTTEIQQKAGYTLLLCRTCKRGFTAVPQFGSGVWKATAETVAYTADVDKEFLRGKKPR